jgi:hypothetical protein
LQDGGYVHVGRILLYEAGISKPHCVKMDTNHQLIWNFTLPGYDLISDFSNSVMKSYFKVPTELPDGSIVLTGYVAYDDTPPNL